MEVKSYRLPNRAFICVLFRKSGLTLVRIGNYSFVNERKLKTDYVVLSELIRVDMSQEANFITQVKSNSTYIGLKQVGEKFVEECGRFGLKPNFSSVARSIKIAKSQGESSDAFFYFYTDRNIKLLIDDKIVFDLIAEIDTVYNPQKIESNLAKLRHLSLLIDQAPELAIKVNRLDFVVESRSDLAKELQSMGINPSDTKLDLNDWKGTRRLNFSNKSAYWVDKPANNTLLWEDTEELDITADYELVVTSGSQRMFSLPCKLMGITRYSDGSALHRFHPKNFNVHVQGNFEVLKKIMLFNLLGQLVEL